jgi:hypothetical protein
MERDIHKLAEWLEKTLAEGIADERALRELKEAQKLTPKPAVADARAKAR